MNIQRVVPFMERLEWNFHRMSNRKLLSPARPAFPKRALFDAIPCIVILTEYSHYAGGSWGSMMNRMIYRATRTG
jgi:hypothetical protein